MGRVRPCWRFTTVTVLLQYNHLMKEVLVSSHVLAHESFVKPRSLNPSWRVSRLYVMCSAASSRLWRCVQTPLNILWRRGETELPAANTTPPPLQSNLCVTLHCCVFNAFAHIGTAPLCTRSWYNQYLLSSCPAVLLQPYATTSGMFITSTPCVELGNTPGGLNTHRL